MQPAQAMYHETTADITVSVLPVFIDERSDPQAGVFFWAYRVFIDNGGDKPVTLLSRYWHIMDAAGKVEEVAGDGVVGEQPRILPGERYEYTSGCSLGTPSGFMRGTYTMQSEDGRLFSVTIPSFALDLPDANPLFN